ncbi:uncharacterized protein K460DRAFT_364714 [Cucurbitaria berberidis CBS 394.84]|uniref:Wax synthase domain-containing protein n=1 Tax=Cucurbitaria berberidis CBS 394.84 TaxID=1168544 RepID=A0A9P4GLT6_9PLEO|nr:uncharacterized protein K460DRAFT_364714 [Cucurbitaria berberidis CBS 394.84]KAF1848728.1 hypothetical protein K460DRAFT_364714 [Cucurbitaria berberidis CBS 394.84]
MGTKKSLIRIMKAIAALYPPLSKRQPMPAFYGPLTFFLSLTPFFFRNRRQTALWVFPILLALCIRAPCYTFGDPSANYYNSSPFIAIPFWFLEFAILTPKDGPNAPRYVGNADEVKKETGVNDQRDDMKTLWERFAWACSLMIPSHRGIGWNWQVKNVPADANQHLPKWAYVRKHVGKMLLAYIRSAAMLVILGYSSSMEQRLASSNSRAKLVFVNALIGWSGAIWVWDRLNCFYSLLAAVSVALGICNTSQWPPLMGSIRDAWSVRQMWSVVYHQMMRKIVSQPAIRITRFIGFPKGSLGSWLSQIYISFFVSCLVHQFQMFMVTRRDMGEFVFFMSQPVAYTLETFVRWLWIQSRGAEKVPGESELRFRRLVGYLWVILWFSSSLPVYVKGCRVANIVGDVFFGSRPFDTGVRLASSYRNSN